MKLYFNSWIFRLPIIRNYEAITLAPVGIFLKGDLCSPEMFRHEMKHVEQMKELGWFKFYYLYLSEFLHNLVKYRNWDKAYRAISFEITAYQAEDEQ